MRGLACVLLALTACAPTPRVAVQKPLPVLPPLPAPDPPVIGDPVVVRSRPEQDSLRPWIQRYERSRAPDPPPDEREIEAAIDAVDLSACFTPSEKDFYWMHVAVLFDPNGTVRDVLVPPDAVRTPVAMCMKQKLTSVVVRPFAGSAALVLRDVPNQ